MEPKDISVAIHGKEAPAWRIAKTAEIIELAVREAVEKEKKSHKTA